MGFLYFFLILMIIVAVFPTLFKLVFFFWIVSLVLSLFRPRKRNENPFEGPRQDYTENQTNQTNQSRPVNRDVIDVEFTQRDADEE